MRHEDPLTEKVARAIADEIGDGFDNAFANKAAWTRSRGERADGIFVSINQPMQDDYIAAAKAALGVIVAEIKEKILDPNT